MLRDVTMAIRRAPAGRGALHDEEVSLSAAALEQKSRHLEEKAPVIPDLRPYLLSFVEVDDLQDPQPRGFITERWCKCLYMRGRDRS